jgi:hypothetical protein
VFSGLSTPSATASSAASTAEELPPRCYPQRWPWLKHLSAGGAYDDFVIEVVRKLADQQGF